ncbi:MAG: tetratricopeptide repeat protein [Nitrospirae bacterium]|nr:tetratricopeptide repeat protein [Nitrospirota bacterium]MCL5238305.1 tetratricopeptide repeat protein [Nitrospirota bacterium]
MVNTTAKELFEKGVEALSQNKTLPALASFEKAIQMGDNPAYYSYLAYCIAKERGQVRKAISLCEEAIQKDTENPVHYLNLGKVYLHAGNKEYAIKVFREGLKFERNQQIINELIKLATRKPPVIPFLNRDNPINKYLGIILKLLGLR